MNTPRQRIFLGLGAILCVGAAVLYGVAGLEASKSSSLSNERGDHPNPRKASPNGSELDTRSVRSLETYIDKLEALGTAPDYLEAQLWYLKRRAYPNDTVDSDAYTRAIEHRDQMLPARLYPDGRLTGADRYAESINGSWVFQGPNNLDVPYTIFWGPRPVAGRVSAVVYDPLNTGAGYYAASGFGGLWRTTDGGATWTPLSDGWPLMHVSSIAVTLDPSTHLPTFYIGTGDFDGGAPYGNGIMKGTTFIEGLFFTKLSGTNQFGNRAVKRIVVDPDDPNTVLAITSRGGGTGPRRIWRSTDAGTNWGPVSPDNSADWSGLSVSIKDSGGVRAFYAVAGGNPPQLLRSTNHGASWTAMASPLSTGGHGRIDIAASTLFSGTVYLLDSTDKKIFKSTNRGQSWTDVTNNFPTGGTVGDVAEYNWSQSGYDFYIGCSSKNGTTDVVYVGLIDLVMSPNGGSSWQSVGGPTYDLLFAKTHNDQHAFAVNPNNANECLIGNDGGVYKFTYKPSDNSSSFVDLNKGIGITQFYSGAWHPTQTSRMLGGAQDNATPAAVGDLANWRAVVGADGGGCGIDPRHGDSQYATADFYGKGKNFFGDEEITFWATNTSWLTGFPKSTTLQGDPVPFIGVLGLDFKDPVRVYLGTNRMYRWTDSFTGGSFAFTHVLFSQAIISAFGLGPSNTTRVYVGADDGQLMVSSDDGGHFGRIDNVSTNGVLLPNRTITCINPRPSNSESILVGLSGTGSGHLWQAAHAQDPALVTWTNVSGSGANALPDVPVNCVARDLEDPDTTFYVGTDIGVFMTRDSGTNWFNAGAPLGLPNVQVNAIATVSGTRSLEAATFGRGIWRIPLPATSPTLIGFSLAGGSSSVRGGAGSFRFNVRLSQMAPPGGTSVALTSSSTTALAVGPITVRVGTTTESSSFATRAVSVDTPVTVTAKLGSVSRSLSVTVLTAMIESFVIEPKSVAAGETATGLVTLNGPAPAGGKLIRFTSASPNVIVPDSIVIPEGQSEGSISISTGDVRGTDVVKISALWGPVPQVVTDTLKVKRPHGDDHNDHHGDDHGDSR